MGKTLLLLSLLGILQISLGCMSYYPAPTAPPPLTLPPILAPPAILSNVTGCVPASVFNPIPTNYAFPDILTVAEVSRLNYTIGLLFDKKGQDPNVNKTNYELITSYGYPCENHTINTTDGYSLLFYRIPYGKNSPAQDGVVRPVVLLSHGLMSSSSCWIATYEKYNIAFNLSDTGYDVWLANWRGTYESQNHVNLSASDNAFWNFTWEDIGTKDVPAAIDYILANTTQSQIYYIGHSMGTTMFFSGMSLLGQAYQKKIKLMVALAPIGYLSQSTSAVRAAAVAEAVGQVTYATTPGSMVWNDGLNFQVGPNFFDQFFSKYAATGCSNEAIAYSVCSPLVFLFMGFDFRQTNLTVLPAFIAKFPNPSSFRLLRHYAQAMIHPTFSRFDYGFQRNLKTYQSCLPPTYDVESITTPIVLFVSTGDAFADEPDVTRLQKRLTGSNVKRQNISISNWNHMDYFVAYSVPEEIIAPLHNYLRPYSNLG